MIIRKLSILLLLGGLCSCSDSQKTTTDLPNLTTFSVVDIPEIQLIKDENFRISQNVEVNKIGDVTADASGNVYFVDEYKRKIQVVDADGNAIGTVGRGGSKPGEFIKIKDIQVKNGNLYTYDERLESSYRFSLNNFELEKATVFSVKNLDVDSLNTATPFSSQILADGNYLVAFQVVKSPEDRRLFYYKVNTNGEIISNQLMAFQNKRLFVEEGQKGMIIMMMPYETETLIVTDASENLYSANTENMLIQKFDKNGEYQEAWNYPVDKVKLNVSDAVDLFTEVDIRRAIRGDDKPPFWPVVARMLVDDKNRFWVATMVNDLEQRRWYVIEPTGEVMGSFLLEGDKEIKSVKNDFIYLKYYDQRQRSDEISRYSYSIN